MPPTPTPQPISLPPVSNRHIPALDGLRGLAILLVLFWHYYRPRWFPAWIGVDLFFVLSGYLITAKLTATTGRPDYYKRFYLHRILRIFPLYYLVLACFYLYVLFLMKAQNLPTVSFYTSHWINFFSFTQNWAIIRYDPPLANRSLEHTWTLAVEEQFYLIWPFILTLLPPKRRLHILIALILLIAAIRCIFFFPSENHLFYFNTFLRMDSLLAGALVFELQLQKITVPTLLPAILTTLLIAAGCLIQKDINGTSPFFQTIGFTLVALLAATALYKVAQSPTPWLEHPFLRYCGNISYGLYLIHYPILFLLEFRLADLLKTQWPTYPTVALHLSIAVCIALSFLISTLSRRYFEAYFLRLKR